MRNTKLLYEKLDGAGYSGSLNDMLYKFLTDLGYSGTVNDMMYNNLVEQGYSGTLTDMLAQWDEAGLELLGPNVITNGNFDEDISGWSDTSSAGGSISWNAGQYLDLVNGTGTARTEQSFPTTINENYRLVCSNPGPSLVPIYIQNSFVDNISIGGVEEIFSFVPTVNPCTLGFRNFDAGTTKSVDTISIRRVYG